MKDHHQMADLSELATEVQGALRKLESAAGQALESGALDASQMREVRRMRRVVRRLHADAADLGEDVLPQGDVTIMSGAS